MAPISGKTVRQVSNETLVSYRFRAPAWDDEAIFGLAQAILLFCARVINSIRLR